MFEALRAPILLIDDQVTGQNAHHFPWFVSAYIRTPLAHIGKTEVVQAVDCIGHAFRDADDEDGDGYSPWRWFAGNVEGVGSCEGFVDGGEKAFIHWISPVFIFQEFVPYR